MALDHYVSQVHLKQFIDPELKHLLRAYRKSNLSTFTPTTRDICRIEDWSTNEFLDEPRIVERFAQVAEPAYEESLGRLISGNIVDKDFITFASFAVFVILSSPALVHTLAPIQTKVVDNLMRQMDAAGKLPASPITGHPDWDNRTTSELLKEGKIQISVNERFPQALLTYNGGKLLDLFSNASWEIVRPFHGTSFITSDFPIAFVDRQIKGYALRFLPCSPNIGIIFALPKRIEYVTEEVMVKRVTLSRSDTVRLNRSIVMSATDIVFSSSSQNWIMPMLEKYRSWRIYGSDFPDLEVGPAKRK